MSKLIKYVGYSRVAGELKFRTAANEARVFQLEKLGDTDVNIVALPDEMTKGDAAKFALTSDFFANKLGAGVAELFVANARDENPFKVAKKVKTVVAKNVVVKTAQVDDDAKLSPKQAAKIRAEFMKKLKVAYEAN